MAGMGINFSSNMLDDIGNGSSMETFFDEILMDTTHSYSHTHNYNPPEVENKHIHTLPHTH